MSITAKYRDAAPDRLLKFELTGEAFIAGRVTATAHLLCSVKNLAPGSLLLLSDETRGALIDALTIYWSYLGERVKPPDTAPISDEPKEKEAV